MILKLSTSTTFPVKNLMQHIKELIVTLHMYTLLQKTVLDILEPNSSQQQMVQLSKVL